ncbi:MAG: metallopeptidase TldD-related protein, partial [Acidobacteriota bacterium]|nr:metallopeptidase TldD-related protein [Acidobacteriota bacterium]
MNKQLGWSKRAAVIGAIGFTAVCVAPVSAASAAKKTDKKPATSVTAPKADPVLLQAMDTELKRAMTDLGSSSATAQQPAQPQPKPYFLSYSVADSESVNIAAQYGAITSSTGNRSRTADVQVRLGTPALDNTHGDHRTSALTTLPLPLTDDRDAIARTLWYATNRGYGKALDALLKVKTEQQVRAKEEDVSADFSAEKAQAALLPAAPKLEIDKAAWEARLREISGVFKQYPDIYFDAASMEASNETDYFVSSEGARVESPNHVARLVVVARTRAADGMDLFRVETFEADAAANLPEQKTVLEKTITMAKNLVDLRSAPITEPYNGPAVLSGRAAAVFFHEVLGHRLEGQRQRGDEEGQTFTKLLNKPILPAFLSVADDPTLTQFHGHPLSGHYAFDDEGQPARKVDLVQDGVLKTFLMSRLPVASFAQSNGHGRA